LLFSASFQALPWETGTQKPKILKYNNKDYRREKKENSILTDLPLKKYMST